MLNVGQILGIVAGSLAAAIVVGETGFGFYRGFNDSKENEEPISKRSCRLWKRYWDENPLLTILFAPFVSGANLGVIAGHYLANNSTRSDPTIDVDPILIDTSI